MPLSASPERPRVHLVDEQSARINQRIEEGNSLAKTLVGMHADEATERIQNAGFKSEVIPPGFLIAADLAPDRIRLLTDEAGTVTRAWGG